MVEKQVNVNWDRPALDQLKKIFEYIKVDSQMVQ